MEQGSWPTCLVVHQAVKKPSKPGSGHTRGICSKLYACTAEIMLRACRLPPSGVSISIKPCLVTEGGAGPSPQTFAPKFRKSGIVFLGKRLVGGRVGGKSTTSPPRAHRCETDARCRWQIKPRKVVVSQIVRFPVQKKKKKPDC